MTTRIYVGNIPFNATEDQLRARFETHGQVTQVAIVADRETGRPRGFAFLEMDSAGAERAIEFENDTDFGGRRMVVNPARARESGGGRSNGSHNGYHEHRARRE